MLYIDIKYYLGEQHGIQKRRASSTFWSKSRYWLDGVVENPGSYVLYYWPGEPDRDFGHEELTYILEDTQISHEKVPKLK